MEEKRQEVKSEEGKQKELEESIQNFKDVMDKEQARLKQKADDVSQMGCGFMMFLFWVVVLAGIIFLITALF